MGEKEEGRDGPLSALDGLGWRGDSQGEREGEGSADGHEWHGVDHVHLVGSPQQEVQGCQGQNAEPHSGGVDGRLGGVRGMCAQLSSHEDGGGLHNEGLAFGILTDVR